MATSETARLIASLELQDKFSPGVSKALGGLSKLDAGITRTSGRAYKAGQQIGTGIKTGAVIAAGAIGFLATQVGFGLRALTELESATAQTNAVIKSTKGVAGQTSDSIRDLAEKYEALNATIDDKVIQSAANVLLTFTAVRKDAFEPAIQAALDMSTALGTDLQGSVIQIGKALQDPIKGITALRRVGVNFSADQIKVIKRLVETGDTLGAQRVILAELNTEFGGSFLAGGATTAGKVAKFQDAIEDLQKTLATALLPVIGKVADALSKFLANPAVVKGANDIGTAIARMFSDENLKAGADFLKGAFETAKSAAPVVAAAAKTTFGFVQAAVGVFKTLPKELQALLVGGFAVNKLTGGLVTNIAGGIIDVVGKSFLQRGGTPANPLFVADVTGGLGGVAGAGTSLIGKLGTLITKVGGLTLVLGGLAGIGAGVSTGGPVGAAIGAASGAALIGGGALLAGPLGAIAGSIAAVGKTLLDIRGQSAAQGQTIAASIGAQLGGGVKLSDLETSLAAVDQGINDIQANPLNVLVAGDALDQLRAQRVLLAEQIAATKANSTGPLSPEDRQNLSDRRTNLGGERDIAEFVTVAKTTNNSLSRGFASMVRELQRAKGSKEIAAAVKNALKITVGEGRGNAAATAKVLATLRSQLKNTHDPKLAASLRSAIAKVEGKLPGRQFAARELAKADQILRSNRTSAQKIEDLKRIERALKDHGLPQAATRIRAKLAEVQRAQVSAANRTTQSVKDKKLHTSVTIPVTNNISVSGRDVTRNQTTFRLLGGTIRS